MTRDEAYNLLTAHLQQPATISHCLATEACMRSLGNLFNENVEEFGITGLVHDIDLELCKADLSDHAILGANILRENGFSHTIIQAVLGHNNKADRQTLLDHCLWVVDPTTGFITASALIRPSKSTSDLTIKSIKKRMKDNRFAAAVSRDQIRACKDRLGLELDEFLSICLKAMNEIRGQLGL